MDSTIRIAAALIDDDRGHLLLVRKAGTRWFMQAGGKIDPDETPRDALQRELREELGVELADTCGHYLGRFTAPAANEPGLTVDAHVFHVRLAKPVVARAEIAEAVWVLPAAAESMPLAPLTRDHVLALVRRLHC